MKRLIPLFLILCLCLCACKNDTTPSTEPSLSETESSAPVTEEIVPEETLKPVDVPEGLKCVCYFEQGTSSHMLLTEEQTTDVYTNLLGRLPDRNKSNPGYTPDGMILTLVFYTGDDFTGVWSEAGTYYGLFHIASNGVVSQTGSPFTGVHLNYQMDPELYTLIRSICKC